MRPAAGFVQESSKHQVKSEKQRTHSAVSTDALAVSTQETTHTRAQRLYTHWHTRRPLDFFHKTSSGRPDSPGGTARYRRTRPPFSREIRVE